MRIGLLSNDIFFQVMSYECGVMNSLLEIINSELITLNS